MGVFLVGSGQAAVTNHVTRHDCREAAERYLGSYMLLAQNKLLLIHHFYNSTFFPASGLRTSDAGAQINQDLNLLRRLTWTILTRFGDFGPTLQSRYQI